MIVIRFGRLNGVISADNGCYHLVCMVKKDEGWSIESTRSWPMANPLPRFLLLNSSLTVGIDSVWRRSGCGQVIDSLIQASSERVWVPFASVQELHHLRDSFVFNCSGVVSEDAYLATIPLNYSTQTHNSFVAVHSFDTWYRIGVVVDRKLVATFKMAPCTSQRLTGHIGRIERYLRMHQRDLQFPQVLCTLGNTVIDADIVSPMQVVKVSAGQEVDGDPVLLKAAGVALCPAFESVAMFSGPTVESLHRRTRIGLVAAALSLVVLGGAATLTIAGLDLWYGRRARQSEQQYQRVFADNSQVRDLVAQTNYLAREVLRLEETLSHPTNWARLLEALGRDRPEGLHLERLGCQVLEKGDGVVQIALTGWVGAEDLVTVFIGRLQKLPFLSQIKLVSMQRDKVKANISEFKILCTLILTAR